MGQRRLDGAGRQCAHDHQGGPERHEHFLRVAHLRLMRLHDGQPRHKASDAAIRRGARQPAMNGREAQREESAKHEEGGVVRAAP